MTSPIADYVLARIDGDTNTVSQYSDRGYQLYGQPLPTLVRVTEPTTHIDEVMVQPMVKYTDGLDPTQRNTLTQLSARMAVRNVGLDYESNDIKAGFAGGFVPGRTYVVGQ